LLLEVDSDATDLRAFFLQSVSAEEILSRDTFVSSRNPLPWPGQGAPWPEGWTARQRAVLKF
jgi:hypothetical protein